MCWYLTSISRLRSLENKVRHGLLDLRWINWARRPGLDHGDTNHSVARRTEVLDASDWTAGELTQVDASGCESADNGGKGNQTAPASGRPQCWRNQQSTGGGCSSSCGWCSERFRDKLMTCGPVPATRYLKCVKPGEQTNWSTSVHYGNLTAAAAASISIVHEISVHTGSHCNHKSYSDVRDTSALSVYPLLSR